MINFFKDLFRERECKRERGGREREYLKQTALSMEHPHKAQSHNPEIMTRVEVKSRHSTNWATQAPLFDSF